MSNNGKNPLEALFAILTGEGNRNKRRIINVDQVERLFELADIPMDDVVARIKERISNTEEALHEAQVKAVTDHAEVMSTYERQAQKIRREYDMAVSQAEAERDAQMLTLDSKRSAAETNLKRVERLMEAVADTKKDAENILQAMGETLEDPKEEPQTDSEASTDELESNSDGRFREDETDELDLSDLESESTR